MIKHPIPPLYDSHSKILILGSFPSVKSREVEFFYGHPRNRFWQVISAILGVPLPSSVSEKRKMLKDAGIALWDVIGECEIEGSADSTIKNVKANDLTTILDTSEIKHIFLNGKTAERYYVKYTLPVLQKGSSSPPYATLPSTSPANAAFDLSTLIARWQAILRWL